MVLILSTPPAIPGVPESPWGALTMTWEGWDGSVWDLNDRDGGVVLLSNVEGLHFPRTTRFTSESRAIPGHRLRGWRAEAREVFWPIYVYADGGQAWLERNNAFMRTIHPDKHGTWTVRSLNGSRRLRLTAVLGDETHSFQYDPTVVGWTRYGILLEAEQPYWEGTPVTRGPWRADAPVPFIDPAGSPPLHISSGSTFGSSSIPNNGDVPVWGKWTIVGPLSGIEVGIGDVVAAIPFDVADGETLVIDTDPRHPSALLGATVTDPDAFGGEDVTTLLGLQDYDEIPAGGEVELHVDASGSGSIEFNIVPLFFRAM